MKHRLLIIDDDTDLTSLLRGLLSPEHEVVVSENHQGEALRLFRKHKPRLVLLDLGLKEGSGAQVLQDILRCDATAAVIILSGNPSLQLARETIKMGARDYVSKPFDLDDLKATIRKHLAASTRAE